MPETKEEKELKIVKVVGKRLDTQNNLGCAVLM
jgi:hypothetical protein